MSRLPTHSCNDDRRHVAHADLVSDQQVQTGLDSRLAEVVKRVQVEQRQGLYLILNVELDVAVSGTKYEVRLLLGGPATRA